MNDDDGGGDDKRQSYYVSLKAQITRIFIMLDCLWSISSIYWMDHKDLCSYGPILSIMMRKE